MYTSKRCMPSISQVFKENDKLSSKRVFGALLMLTVVVCVACNREHSLLAEMLYTGAGLIGFGTIQNIVAAAREPKK